MAKVVEYVRPLAENVRKRHSHAQAKGKILRFAVQLELFYNDQWMPVIRYDTAHGYAHMDVFDLGGKSRKERLEMALEQALTLADEEIDQNWPDLVGQFMKSRP